VSVGVGVHPGRLGERELSTAGVEHDGPGGALVSESFGSTTTLQVVVPSSKRSRGGDQASRSPRTAMIRETSDGGAPKRVLGLPKEPKPPSGA